MHPSAARLFRALQQNQGVATPLEPGRVAHLMAESPATITNWKARGVSKAGALKAGELHGISPTWISTGEGSMLLAVTSIPKTGDALAVQSNVLLVGLNKSVPRIAWNEIQGFIQGMFTPAADRHEVVASQDVTARCFMVEIDGDAMASASAGESIPQGAMLICDPDRTAKAGDVVIALHPKTGEPMARRIICDAGVWFLKASNPAYPMIEVSGLDCVVAKAIEVITRRTLL